MTEPIPPFDPENQIRSVGNLPPSIEACNVAFLLSAFFAFFEKGLATEEQFLRYLKALSSFYSIPEKDSLELSIKVRSFDFEQKSALIAKEADRCMWCGKFLALDTYGLLTPLELKRAKSAPWWDEVCDLFFDWLASDFKDDDL